MMPYLGKVLEYYASGSFFANVYGVSGVEVFDKARSGDTEALDRYQQLGTHLGEALKMLMFAFDPQAFVLGGSVIKGFDYFKESMMTTVASFPYRNVLQRLRVEVSELEDSAILGAAAVAKVHLGDQTG